MDMNEIEVIVDREGKVSLRVKGVQGASCLDLTKALEEALGAEVESRTRTSEFYENPKTTTEKSLVK